MTMTMIMTKKKMHPVQRLLARDFSHNLLKTKTEQAGAIVRAGLPYSFSVGSEITRFRRGLHASLSGCPVIQVNKYTNSIRGSTYVRTYVRLRIWG